MQQIQSFDNLLITVLLYIYHVLYSAEKTKPALKNWSGGGNPILFGKVSVKKK